MLVLAIDTSTDRLGLALRRDETPLGELHLELGRRHAEKILIALDGLLSDLGVRPRDLKGVCVSLGPGSFTGLRIGLAFAKGMAVATGAPLVGVPTLDVLAHGAEPWVGPVIACLDARRNEVYFCAYHLGAGGAERMDAEYQVGSPAEVVARCRVLGPRVLVVGTGAEAVRSAAGPDVLVARRGFALPRAGVLAELGVEALRRGEGVDPDHVEPIYVRRSDAEIRRGSLAGRT